MRWKNLCAGFYLELKSFSPTVFAYLASQYISCSIKRKSFGRVLVWED